MFDWKSPFQVDDRTLDGREEKEAGSLIHLMSLDINLFEAVGLHFLRSKYELVGILPVGVAGVTFLLLQLP